LFPGGRSGFGSTTSLADAREALADRCVPHGRTETVSVADAEGRLLAASVTANRAIPHHDRAAVDGWVEVAEAAEGVPAEATVTVQHWDRCP
jgi:molybdopterin molybdotransferase